MRSPVLLLVSFLALAAVHTHAAFTFTASNSVLSATGGTLAINSPNTIIDWVGVTADDMVIEAPSVLSLRIENGAFTNVAFDLTMVGASGLPADAAADAARQLVLLANAFAFDGSTTFYHAKEAAFKLDTTAYFAAPGPPIGAPLRVDTFTIATPVAQPVGYAGIADRTGNSGIDVPTADTIRPIGLWLLGGDAANTALLQHFVTAHGGTHCTTLDQSVAYTLSQLNAQAYGRVDPAIAGPGTADIRYNANWCNGVGNCDVCATAPYGTPPSTTIGRFSRCTLVFDPLVGKVVLSCQVEDIDSDAVTIDTVPFVDVATTAASGVCANRLVVSSDTVIHSDDATNGRFAADPSTIWAVGAPHVIIDSGVSLTVRDYTASLDMGALAGCNGDLGTENQMSVTLHISHTALLANDVVRTMATNSKTFTIFWYNQFVVALGQTGDEINVVNPGDFRLVAREPIFDSPTRNVFQVEIYTPSNPTSPAAQRFAGGALTETKNVGALGDCGLSLGSVIDCTTVLSLTITDGCLAAEGVFPNAEFCYQVIEIATDKPYNFVLLPVAFDLELRSAAGVGAILSQATMSTLLDFYLSSTTIEGTNDNLVPVLSVFSGADGIFFDDTLDKPQETNFTAGEKMCFKLSVTGFSYLDTRWDSIGIDLIYGSYCAFDHANLAGVTNFDTFNVGQQATTGCNSYIPAPVQRVTFLDAFSTACRMVQTGVATDQRFVCLDNQDLHGFDNQNVVGTCDNGVAGEADAHCMLPSESGGLSPNLLGAQSCSTPGECNNGGIDHKITNEIPFLDASWSLKHCRSVADLEVIVQCTTANRGSVCSVPSECSRPVHSIVQCIDAPLLVFGPENIPAPITFNMGVLVHLTSSTGTISSRRLLATAEDPRTKHVIAGAKLRGSELETVNGVRKLLGVPSTGTTAKSSATQIDNLTSTCAAGFSVAIVNGLPVCVIPGSSEDPTLHSAKVRNKSAKLRSTNSLRSDTTAKAGVQTETPSVDSAPTDHRLDSTFMLASGIAGVAALIAGVAIATRRRRTASRKALENAPMLVPGEIAAASVGEESTV